MSEINVASYTTDTVGLNMTFGYPISETQRLGVSVGLTDTEITSGRYAVQEIRTSPRLIPGIDQYYVSTLQPDGLYSGPEVLLPISELPESALAEIASDGFLDVNGDSFTNLAVTGSWLQSTLNRGQLATRGVSNSVSMQVSVPGSDLEFYKFNYRGDFYFPIAGEFTSIFVPNWATATATVTRASYLFMSTSFRAALVLFAVSRPTLWVLEVRHQSYTRREERQPVLTRTVFLLRWAARMVVDSVTLLIPKQARS